MADEVRQLTPLAPLASPGNTVNTFLDGNITASHTTEMSMTPTAFKYFGRRLKLNGKGLGMSTRQEVMGKIIPFVANPTIIVAEGHAFRKGLCEGKEIVGFEWLRLDCLYNNGTCHSPDESWLYSGHENDKHKCTWVEWMGMAVYGEVITFLVKTAGIIRMDWQPICPIC